MKKMNLGGKTGAEERGSSQASSAIPQDMAVEEWSLDQSKKFFYSNEGRMRYSGYGHVDALIYNIERGVEKIYAARRNYNDELVGVCSIRTNPKDNQMFFGIGCSSVFQVHYCAWPLSPDTFVPAVLDYLSDKGISGFDVIVAKDWSPEGVRWVQDFGFETILSSYGNYEVRKCGAPQAKTASADSKDSNCRPSQKDRIIRQYGPDPTDPVVDYTEDFMGLKRLQQLIGGYIEVRHVGRLDVVCDEEFLYKYYITTVTVDGVTFNGPILVGHMNNEGLEPASLKEIEAFEARAEFNRC